jgi:hypothetical protein
MAARLDSGAPARQASVTLERSWWTGSADDGGTNALTLQVPLGPVRLMQRVQWGRTDYRHRAVPFGFDRQQSSSGATYTPGPWGNMNYQQSTQWFDDGTVQEEVSRRCSPGVADGSNRRSIPNGNGFHRCPQPSPQLEGE